MAEKPRKTSLYLDKPTSAALKKVIKWAYAHKTMTSAIQWIIHRYANLLEWQVSAETVDPPRQLYIIELTHNGQEVRRERLNMRV